MKKGIFLLGAVLLLTACGNEPQADAEPVNSTNATEQTTKETETKSTQQAGETMQTIFTGKIESVDQHFEDSVSVLLKKVEAVEDSENIVPNFHDGVILNLPAEKAESLEKGMTIQAEMNGLPIMTMSIPPQVPGENITITIVE
ncbi:membrane lipoprotein lipid attachment site-containing protein [Enterococcus mediterraneensis]|uniref:membrane lipoprotein lipid attachment site-containing protein n=1 Tax=Enterococcus mediterraneensis TaxID=2364791 RepID=UPI000F05E69B|nr:membrane lipoprotein lipid attachment site-containing protein [Enterococcus mediterraneensis]